MRPFGALPCTVIAVHHWPTSLAKPSFRGRRSTIISRTRRPNPPRQSADDEHFRCISAAVDEGGEPAARRHGDPAAAPLLEARVGWAFDLLHASEYGRELIDQKNRLCGKTNAETNAQFAGVIERIIERGVAEREIALSRLAMKPSEAAASSSTASVTWWVKTSSPSRSPASGSGWSPGCSSGVCSGRVA